METEAFLFTLFAGKFPPTSFILFLTVSCHQTFHTFPFPPSKPCLKLFPARRLCWNGSSKLFDREDRVVDFDFLAIFNEIEDLEKIFQPARKRKNVRTSLNVSTGDAASNCCRI